MSYGGTVFQLSFERLRAIRSSRSTSLLDKLALELKLDDESFEDVEDDDDDGPPPLPSEALRQIIMGDELASEFPERYGMALIAIYHHLGRRLDNSAVFPVGWSYITAIDSALAAESIPAPVRLASLFARGLPLLNLEPPEPFPTHGYLTPEEVDSARGPLARAKWSGCETSLHPVLQQFGLWINQAATEEDGLVGYYG